MVIQSDITVIIVAYNSRAHIAACLDALRSQTRLPAQILLVENGSAPDKRVDQADLGEDVTYIDSACNLGFAAANNLAARQARSEWIAFLNPDAFAEPDWIEELEAARRRYPDDRVFGCHQIDAGDSRVIDGVGDVYHAIGIFWRGGHGAPVADAPKSDGTVFSACGAAMFLERSFFLSIGGFDEAFFCYCEDIDFCYRARLAGERVVQLAHCYVRHVGSGSSEDWRFPFHHGVRNRLWTYLQNTPMPLLTVTLSLHVAVTLIDFLSALRQGRGRAFAKAITEGLSQWRRVLHTRRLRQRSRSASTTEIASAMSWSVTALSKKRAAYVRPIDE